MKKINRKDQSCFSVGFGHRIKRSSFSCAVCARKGKATIHFPTNGGYLCEECFQRYRSADKIEDRRRLTLELRYGVNIPTQEQFTSEEIGQIFGVTFQSALNWEKAGLEYMREQFRALGVNSSQDLGFKG